MLPVLLGTEAIALAPGAYEMALRINLSGAGFFDTVIPGFLLLTYSQLVAALKAFWSRWSGLGSTLIHLDKAPARPHLEDLCFDGYALIRRIPQRLTQGASMKGSGRKSLIMRRCPSPHFHRYSINDRPDGFDMKVNDFRPDPLCRANQFGLRFNRKTRSE